ncbi:CmcJ/NvfI family oxidoreductase [Streptomyces sp. URMC 126]|uniref:CmcJ/NvfI family oxidoreductase n=1 Tax=Streptomyces sp. URMC 126 TaxID=3423401 RepID=UPI003F1AF46E
MPTVSGLLNYSAPLTPEGRTDDWCVDALSRAPEVVLNFRMVPVETVVTDLRDGTVRPALDETGFEKADAPTRVDQRALAEGAEPALARYRRETAELLTALTGADDVRFFDATVRRKGGDGPAVPFQQSPHLRVHVDQTPRSARARAALHTGPGRPFRRFQIVNVWRPLLAPVRNYPLAVCDYRSVDLAADLVATRLEFPAWLKDRETYSVRHNPRHRWHYWSALTPDEAIVFKCHDSASRGLAAVGDDAERGGPGGPEGSGSLEGPARPEGPDGPGEVAGLVPHTAFLDPEGPADGPLRTSLELRAVLFHH